MLTARFLKGENSACIDILLTLLEKLPRFEQNIYENDVFSNTFVYRRFKCSNTFTQIDLQRQYTLQPHILFIPHQLKRAPKWNSRLLISVSDSIFKELRNFINLNEEPISV